MWALINFGPADKKRTFGYKGGYSSDNRFCFCWLVREFHQRNRTDFRYVCTTVVSNCISVRMSSTVAKRNAGAREIVGWCVRRRWCGVVVVVVSGAFPFRSVSFWSFAAHIHMSLLFRSFSLDSSVSCALMNSSLQQTTSTTWKS